MKIPRGFAAVGLIFSLAVLASASGRRGDDDDDKPDRFPDYNQLEIHHMAPPPPESAPATNVPPPMPIVPPPPPAGPGEDLTHPKPPPNVVPKPDDSEPDLPSESTAAPTSPFHY